MPKLSDIRIACVATDGFEYSELTKPKSAFEAEGATVDVLSPKDGEIRGMDHHEWNPRPVPVTRIIGEADPNDYDALLLPGGVMNPDALRLSKEAIAFIGAFVDEGKPIAAICHGPWTLIDAEGVGGKRMTSWPSLRTDLENAGAEWVDEEVVVDGNLVTSRKPDDIPAFNREFIALIASAAA
jgi:protease I